MINVIAQNTIPQFLPFSFTATADNQTIFGPLSNTPIAVVTLAIMGSLQNPLAQTPDYTLTDLNIVLSEGVPNGTTIYGMIQIS